MRRGPAYLGGSEPPSPRKLIGCVVVTFIAIAVAIFVIYSLPHWICGHGEVGCPGAGP